MNRYPSWIHRIPELLEILAWVPEQPIDRRRIEELFQLGRSASHQLLRGSVPSVAAARWY